MTRFAAVQKGFADELLLMSVLVAVLAGPVGNPVLHDGILANMALVAGHGVVLAHQRIIRGLMPVCKERGGIEAVFVVAGRAFPSVRPRPELGFVRVLLGVAVQAPGVHDRSREVSAPVAFRARKALVLADEREIRTGMIQTGKIPDLLPSVRRMAGIASPAQGASVWVLVTRGAGPQ